jgi:hypothetical protein
VDQGQIPHDLRTSLTPQGVLWVGRRKEQRTQETSTVSKTLNAAARRLRAVALRFDADGAAAKRDALRRLARVPLAEGAALPLLYETLLFLRAHPSDRAMLAQVGAAFARLASFLRRGRGEHGARLQEQGLPFVEMTTRFTHDCLRWLQGHPHCRVAIDSWGDGARADLNAILALTLPSVERSETTASLDNAALLAALRVPSSRQLAFVINELSRLDALPLIKDHLFDELELFVRVTPTDRRLSKAYSRLPMRAVYFQTNLLRNFDAAALMNQRLPAARALDGDARGEVVRVIKTSFVLTSRETDPGTYMDERTLRVWDLERGLSVAIYGMVPARQMPLESYVGFTLFKNGLAAAYGGAWVFGARAGFGMNIFEPYRGGESGYMMCQVLRTYRQAFGVDFFEVDAHQFGLDNPDGIATGAFWFYHRYGFRPLDRALVALAERERRKIGATPGYRSSEKTLLRFTGSNVALNFGRAVPAHVFDLTVPVTRRIGRRYGGDRLAAEREAVAKFVARTGAARRLAPDQQRVLAEMALVAEANAISNRSQLAILRKMVAAKPVDLWAYQRLWFDFFASGRTRGRRKGKA